MEMGRPFGSGISALELKDKGRSPGPPQNRAMSLCDPAAQLEGTRSKKSAEALPRVSNSPPAFILELAGGKYGQGQRICFQI